MILFTARLTNWLFTVANSPPPEIQTTYAAAGGQCFGFFRVVQVQQFASIPLPVYTPFTSSVAPGSITTFAMDVPSWASFATNSLIFADGPVKCSSISSSAHRTGGDTILLANSMGRRDVEYERHAASLPGATSSVWKT